MERRNLVPLATVLVSVAFHLLAYVALRWAGTLPDIGFEIQLPAEVELGMLEPSANPPKAPAPAPSALAAAQEAGRSAAVSEPVAIAPKPRPPRKKPAPAPAIDAGPAALAAYAPPGAQLALRVDLDRIRDSRLAEPVGALLAAIPDFQRILGGSGVEPLRDLSRLFLASPNLEREKLVIAGRYLGGPEVARRAVESLASKKGTTARWSKRRGIPIAPWENDDTTARVLALIGAEQFAITRPDDLPRVLAIAAALAKRPDDRGDAGPRHPADALLAMAEDEAVALAVEDARAFVRGDVRHVPERLKVSLRLTGPDTIAVSATGSYPDEAAAQVAAARWNDVRARFARHPLVALADMAAPLQAMEVTADGVSVTAETTVTFEQAERVLGFVRGSLTTRAQRQAKPTPDQ